MGDCELSRNKPADKTNICFRQQNFTLIDNKYNARCSQVRPPLLNTDALAWSLWVPLVITTPCVCVCHAQLPRQLIESHSGKRIELKAFIVIVLLQLFRYKNITIKCTQSNTEFVRSGWRWWRGRTWNADNSKLAEEKKTIVNGKKN